MLAFLTVRMLSYDSVVAQALLLPNLIQTQALWVQIRPDALHTGCAD